MHRAHGRVHRALTTIQSSGFADDDDSPPVPTTPTPSKPSVATRTPTTTSTVGSGFADDSDEEVPQVVTTTSMQAIEEEPRGETRSDVESPGQAVDDSCTIERKFSPMTLTPREELTQCAYDETVSFETRATTITQRHRESLLGLEQLWSALEALMDVVINGMYLFHQKSPPFFGNVI